MLKHLMISRIIFCLNLVDVWLKKSAYFGATDLFIVMYIERKNPKTVLKIRTFLSVL